MKKEKAKKIGCGNILPIGLGYPSSKTLDKRNQHQKGNG